MLAPDTSAAEAQITSNLNAEAALTNWALALENCVLPQLTPAPSWYTAISSSLQTAQQNASSWVTSTGPQVFAGSTQAYINYANVFGPASTSMSTIVNAILKNGGTPTAAQVAQLTTYVNALLELAQTNLASATTWQADINALSAQIATQQTAISNAIAAAVAEEGSDAAQIAAIQQQISGLMQQLASETTAANDSSISAGTGVASLLWGLTFGLALAGGTLGVGVVVGAVLSIGSAIGSEVLYDAEVQQTIANITALLGPLSADQVQLAMLQGMVTTLQTVSGSGTSALESFADFADVWAETADDLSWLLVVLAQPEIDVSTIPALNDLADANTAWQAIATFAQDAQNVTIQQPSTVFPMPATVTPVAA
jgi:Bacillus haemolytic enterotoxin (HBL)